MNFFEHQDRARRNTRYLVLLLVAAVFSLIVITTLLFAVLASWGQDHYGQAPLSHWKGSLQALNPSTSLWISLSISCSVIL